MNQEFAVFCCNFSSGEIAEIHWCRTFQSRERAIQYTNGMTTGKNYIRIKDEYMHTLFVDEREIDFDSKIPMEMQTFPAYSVELLDSNPIIRKNQQ